MDYSIYLGNKNLTLKENSFKIKSLFAKCDEMVEDEMKCYQAKYNLILESLGKEQTDEIIGTNWKDCDPNIIDLAFLNIFNEYNRPVMEKKQEEIQNSLNSLSLDKLQTLINVVKK